MIAKSASKGDYMQYMIELDRYNRNILHELEQNGRISNLDLAERIGLSPSACLRRVQELERSRVIKGYRAVLDREKLGIGFIAYISVGLSDHTVPSQESFEAAMRATPAVRECLNTTGVFEYLLRVELPDITAYKKFHVDVLGGLPQVNSITTYVVMDSPKDDRG